MISVVIPVYNAAPFLERAVNSALQFKVVQEIILIEDGSTDNSLEVCKELSAQNSIIKLFLHEDNKNLGAAQTRNLGIVSSQATYIAFLDADDYYLSNRFDSEVKCIEQNIDFKGMFGSLGITYLNDDIKEKFDTYFKNREVTRVKDGIEKEELFPSLLGMKGNKVGYFHLDTLTVKRSILIKMNYCFNPILRLHQDTEFIIRLSYHTNLISNPIKIPIAIRGVHENNRITRAYDKKIYWSNQLKLWGSLNKWADSVHLPINYKNFIFRWKTCIEIANSSYFKAIKILIITIFTKDVKILKFKNFLIKRFLLLS